GGPAPAEIDDVAGAAWFVFQTSWTVYDWPPVRLATACTKAAFGDCVPLLPPLSFHAASDPLIMMPRSWLMPAVSVHRSALPPSTTRASLAGESEGGVTPVTGCHVTPSLPVS